MPSYKWPASGSSGGVTSLNSLTGDLTLAAGANITITPSGSTLTIAASGGGGSGVDTIGTIDGGTLSSDALFISGTTLFAQSASTTKPGMVNNTTQSFSGNKTFTGTIGASNLSGTNTGNLTLSAVGSSPSANGASLSGQALTLQPFDDTHPGVVTASGGGTSNFLRADGSWAAPSGGTGTVTSVSMTVPSFLSISGSPITVSGTLGLTLSGTALPTANGGTGVTASGGAGNVLMSNGSVWSSQPLSNSSAFVSYASSQVTTVSTGITSGTFGTFSNSPAFTFTPTITGTYKVYSSVPIEVDTNTQVGIIRIFNTSGGATLLNESQAWAEVASAGGFTGSTAQPISLYTLTAGTTYVFDIQGKVTGGSLFIEAGLAPFYMFAEGIGLNTSSPTGSYAQAKFSNATSWSTTSVTFADPTVAAIGTFTVMQSSNITLTRAGSNLPGITFTPASASAIYLITARGILYNSSVNSGASIQMTDGSTVIAGASLYEGSPTAAAVASTGVLTGIFVPGTGSPVTVKLQMAITNAGTAFMSGSQIDSITNTLEFTVLRIV